MLRSQRRFERRHSPRVFLGLVVALATLGGLAACSPAAAPEPATSSLPAALNAGNAQLLAVSRFRNFDAGTRSIGVTIPASSTEAETTVSGWLDFTTSLGYGGVTQKESGSLGLIAWNTASVAVREGAVPHGEPAQGETQEVRDQGAPLPPATDGWRSAALSPSTSRLMAALAVTLTLGTDRPENPLLLQQSDAAFLGSESIDGTPVQLFAGPSPATAQGTATADNADTADGLDRRVRYWLTADGTMLRVQVKLGNDADWTVIDFGDAGDVALPALIFDPLFVGTSTAN
jgi:hypothetical protein